MRFVGPEREGGLLPAVSLADLAEIVYRRRWGIILIVLASIIGTMGYVMLIRGDSYVAEARLLDAIANGQPICSCCHGRFNAPSAAIELMRIG